MSWSINYANAASPEELKELFNTDQQIEHVPIEVRDVIIRAIDQIPYIAGDAATGFSLSTTGHVQQGEFAGTSNFSISVGNNFVTTAKPE